MNTHSIRNILMVTAISGVVLACGSKKPVPEVTPSTEFPVYALTYPGELKALVTRYKEDAAKASELIATFSDCPKELKDPDWAKVLEIVETADETGRSRAFADEMEKAEHTRAFFEQGKDDILRRVNGAVKNTAEKEECSCELDVYGKIAYALKEGVDRSVEKQLLEKSQAYQLIEQNTELLGKKNAEVLKKAVVNVTYASYVVYVELPELYAEMERRNGEQRKVKNTLKEALEKEREYAARTELGKADKKVADERIAALEKVLAAIDPICQEATGLISDAEKEIPSIREKYKENLNRLMARLKELKSRSPIK